MSVSLKQIFDEASTHIVYDPRLAKDIEKYVGGLMNRNEAHVHFFGSNLTGVYPLRFKTADRNEWFVDIMDVDEFEVTRRVVKESSLPESWVRATDAFNLDCLYTIHRFLNSDLGENQKRVAIESVGMALNIKLLGSIMAAYFKYDVDERVAQEVYARLSRKFYIKRFGNWRLVLEHRSADICAPTSKWLPVLKAFTNDEQIAQCISDIQGRLRSMIKYIWDIFAKVRADEAKFNRTSMSIETGGEKVLQDLKRDPDIYKRYAIKCALDSRVFIKPELVTIVDAEMKTMPVKLLHDVLDAVVLDVNKVNSRTEKLIENVIEFTVDLLQTDRSSAKYVSDLAWLLNKVKLHVTAAKSKDSVVLDIRQESEALVKRVAKTKNPTWIASLKTGLVLYIVARAFSMKKYS